MKERNFLTDIKIVGAMLASYEGKLLHYTIPNLLKWCDWVLIMLDNETKPTHKVAWEYKKKYPARIRIEYTHLPRITKERARAKTLIRKEKGGYLRRYKEKASLMRECVFKYMRNCLDYGEAVDLLMFVDADEIFSDYLPEVLEKFWAMPDRIGLSFKPSGVFGDMKTIKKRTMSPHTRVLKFSKEFTAIPYRSLAHYVPLTRETRWESRYVMIHLNNLLEETRWWRNIHWKKAIQDPSKPLYTLDKDIRQMSPVEILGKIKGKPDTTIEEYLKKHNLTV